MHIAGRLSVPTIVSPPSNECTSLLVSEDGRRPTRSFTEEVDRAGTTENDQSAKRVPSDVNEMSGMYAHIAHPKQARTCKLTRAGSKTKSATLQVCKKDQAAVEILCACESITLAL